MGLTMPARLRAQKSIEKKATKKKAPKKDTKKKKAKKDPNKPKGVKSAYLFFVRPYSDAPRQPARFSSRLGRRTVARRR